MKKRFLSLILSMVLCLGLFAPAMGAEKTFSDMPKTHWAYQAVGAMVDKGLRHDGDDLQPRQNHDPVHAGAGALPICRLP